MNDIVPSPLAIEYFGSNRSCCWHTYSYSYAFLLAVAVPSSAHFGLVFFLLLNF